MDKIEVTKIDKKVITDVICDSCGNSCLVDKYEINNPAHEDYGQMHYSFSYMEMSATWGWLSNNEGEIWKAKICEKCAEEKLSFIKFHKKSYFSKL